MDAKNQTSARTNTNYDVRHFVSVSSCLTVCVLHRAHHYYHIILIYKFRRFFQSIGYGTDGVCAVPAKLVTNTVILQTYKCFFPRFMR